MTIKQLEKEVKVLREIESKNNIAKYRIREIEFELTNWHNKYNRATKEKREKLINRRDHILEIKRSYEKEILTLEYDYKILSKLSGELNRRKEVKKAREVIKNSDKVELLKKISKKTISRSPFSDSTYFHKKNEKIDWGIKPENSYRLADHWNWKQGFDEDYNTVLHCALKEVEYKNERMICVQKKGLYEVVTLLTKEEYDAFQILAR